ncbi:hypothetical protein D187_007431 [Cystobacter fuscus DSM 2262]|uniref:Uncharacterized protein n=1 Tax=Cystobacter fuscus (strain ATCC 25194 / DSM 2262 / NBRC 100088 / M29) TaxID=1242864 RepID=S9Q460_CYSF2|nr:hypothetical protein D187_007431 [Cystobacter fuscus DSM 2262]
MRAIELDERWRLGGGIDRNQHRCGGAQRSGSSAPSALARAHLLGTHGLDLLGG